MSLRTYQRDAIARVQSAYRDGARAVCLQMPTGAGKTHTAAGGIIAPTVARGRRVVFAAHLEEILDDTASRLSRDGLPVGIIKSGRPSDPSAPVQVCSTPTLARMVERGDTLPAADRVILDEAHRAASNTARAILGWYRDRGALILGLTATPERGDGQPLDEFEAIVCGPGVRALIADGALVPARVFAPDRVLERGVARDPVELVLSERAGRRVVIFAPDGAAANDIRARLNAAGYACEAVLDGTPGDVRKGVRARIADGSTRGIVTVRAVVEGFDAPALDCAVLCAAFTTVAPYLQAIGRVVRAHPGKADAIVDDLRGAFYFHGPPDDDRVWSLAGTQGKSATEHARGLRRCGACGLMCEPVTRCPHCGSTTITDPRPMRIQKAEMYAMSSVPVGTRALRYLEATERSMVSRGMRPEKAAVVARAKAPAWVREALDATG